MLDRGGAPVDRDVEQAGVDVVVRRVRHTRFGRRAGLLDVTVGLGAVACSGGEDRRAQVELHADRAVDGGGGDVLAGPVEDAQPLTVVAVLQVAA